MLQMRVTFERCLILLQLSAFLQIMAIENCTSNTYHDKELGLCLPCSSCDAFSIQLKDCTQTSNTVCLTCVGHNREKHSECKRCPPCRKGHFLTSPCTFESSNVCQRCRKGTYSAKPSFSTSCLACLGCKELNRRVVRSCKAHKDAVCGTCRKGYYEVPGIQKCLPCRPCTSGRLTVKECQRWEGEMSCGFVVHRSGSTHRTRGHILKYDMQATTESFFMTSSMEHINRTSHVNGISEAVKGGFGFINFIIILSISLVLLTSLIVVVLAAVQCRRKKSMKTKTIEERSSLISDKRDTEVTWSSNGHCVSSLPNDRVTKSYNSLSQSDPGQRTVHQNASAWVDLLLPARKTATERYQEPRWCSASVLNVKQKLSQDKDSPNSWTYSPEPLQPPPPLPSETALFIRPPEIPPRRQSDFKTL